MRVISTLLIIAIICQGAFAVSSKTKQSKLLIEKVNASLSSTHLGRALKGMVQIASKLGYEFTDLYHAFDELKNSLLDMMYEKGDIYLEQRTYHFDIINQLDRDIFGYEQDISDTTRDLSNHNFWLQFQRDQLEEALINLEKSKQVKEQTEYTLTYSEEHFQTESDEFASVRVVIAEAVAKLKEAQGHFENAQLSGFSFVQLKNTFVSFAQKVKTATEKLPAKHQLFIKPVIQAMLAIKQDSGSSSIQLAIDALNSLQAYFDQALSDLTNIHVRFKAYLEELIAYHSANIEVLENEVIPDLTNKVNQEKSEIQFTEFSLNFLVQQLEDANLAMKIENLNWEQVEARFKAFGDRNYQEYRLVDNAERLIRTAQNNLEA